ncbi:MAG: peptidylprolyl isomerase [Prolixibacteraceae bacterium]|nr:peptidylprolyl isomerase [Prolixibacteraceae bacterium]MBN2649885.1 peptidylprolyl isomerase [Prolixibacteraceae bacterium]
MNIKISILYLALVFTMVACSGKKSNAGDSDRPQVLIETSFGDMTVELYNETPQHRDNFLKLAEEGFYNDLLFHRVIESFMIQGGDPDSKNASPNKRLGSGGPGYTIPAEFVDGFYHKKGALSAARQGDNVNPEKESSGSQFYIVQGKVWNDEMIRQFEEQQKFQSARQLMMKMYNERMDEVKRYQQNDQQDSIMQLRIEIQEKAEQQVDSSLYKINSERREIYTSVGGTPNLDGAYTVFGEVIEGLNVIDSIAAVKTDRNDRPLDNIIMKMKVLKK